MKIKLNELRKLIRSELNKSLQEIITKQTNDFDEDAIVKGWPIQKWRQLGWTHPMSLDVVKKRNPQFVERFRKFLQKSPHAGNLEKDFFCYVDQNNKFVLTNGGGHWREDEIDDNGNKVDEMMNSSINDSNVLIDKTNATSLQSVLQNKPTKELEHLSWKDVKKFFPGALQVLKRNYMFSFQEDKEGFIEQFNTNSVDNLIKYVIDFYTVNKLSMFDTDDEIIELTIAFTEPGLGTNVESVWIDGEWES